MFYFDLLRSDFDTLFQAGHIEPTKFSAKVNVITCHNNILIRDNCESNYKFAIRLGNFSECTINAIQWHRYETDITPNSHDGSNHCG